MRKRFTVRDARAALARLKRRLPRGATLRALARGMTAELEHRDVTRGDPALSARIALAHLRERPDYYALLAKLERAPRRNPSGTAYLFAAPTGKNGAIYIVSRRPYAPGDEGDYDLATAVAHDRGGDIMLLNRPLRSSVTLFFAFDEDRNVEWLRAVYHAGPAARGVAWDLDGELERRGAIVDRMVEIVTAAPPPLLDERGRPVGSYELRDWPYLDGDDGAASPRRNPPRREFSHVDRRHGLRVFTLVWFDGRRGAQLQWIPEAEWAAFTTGTVYRYGRTAMVQAERRGDVRVDGLRAHPRGDGVEMDAGAFERLNEPDMVALSAMMARLREIRAQWA